MSTLFLSTKDVQKIAKLGETAARLKLAKVKTAYDIPKYEAVNVFEYCKFYRLEVDYVIRMLEKPG